jgi:hypothetical protein
VLFGDSVTYANQWRILMFANKCNIWKMNEKRRNQAKKKHK